MQELLVAGRQLRAKRHPLDHRDVTPVAISCAPFSKLEPFRKRMVWTLKWVSSAGGGFNFDYHVSFRPEEVAKGEIHHNYSQRKSSLTEVAEISMFYKDQSGGVFHTYSCYQRGLDIMNAGYNFLDLIPKGCDEDGLSHTQAWVCHRDSYDS